MRVDKLDDGNMPVEEIDRDFALLASLCESGAPAEDEQLERALHKARRQARPGFSLSIRLSRLI